MRAGANGASGKSAKRRQWRKKRADFEEVPRLAATTVAGNRLARRWATAGPYGRFERSLRGGRLRGSPLRTAWRLIRRADVGIGPYGCMQGVWEKNHPVTALPCQPPLGKGAEEDGRKQRFFDAIKPPPGGGGFRRGICGEGDLRGRGYSALAGFKISPPYGRQPQRWR